MRHIEVQSALIPALGLGTWQLTGSACEKTVRDAVEIGYRHIDTAQAYGNESEIGAALRRSGIAREDFFLTTKVWMDRAARPEAEKSVLESLRRLDTGYVDLVLIHWPSEVPVEETLDALQELQAERRVRLIGLSNFTPSLVERAVAHARIACHQIEYHPFLGQDQHLELARRHRYMITAYAPLARGRVLQDERLRAVAEKHDRSPVQVALRWLLQQDRVAAIPKASSREHLESNFAVFDFTLDEDDMATIDECRRGERLIDPDFAPAWGT